MKVPGEFFNKILQKYRMQDPESIYLTFVLLPGENPCKLHPGLRL